VFIARCFIVLVSVLPLLVFEHLQLPGTAGLLLVKKATTAGVAQI